MGEGAKKNGGGGGGKQGRITKKKPNQSTNVSSNCLWTQSALFTGVVLSVKNSSPTRSSSKPPPPSRSQGRCSRMKKGCQGPLIKSKKSKKSAGGGGGSLLLVCTGDS